MKYLIWSLMACFVLVGALPAAAAPVRTISITAKNWSFSPATITLKVNQPVKLVFRSKEGIHAIIIPDLGVNQVVNVSSTPSEIKLTPKKTGVFVGHCAIFCGAGHANMIITIRVVK